MDGGMRCVCRWNGLFASAIMWPCCRIPQQEELAWCQTNKYTGMATLPSRPIRIHLDDVIPCPTFAITAMLSKGRTRWTRITLVSFLLIANTEVPSSTGSWQWGSIHTRFPTYTPQPCQSGITADLAFCVFGVYWLILLYIHIFSTHCAVIIYIYIFIYKYICIYTHI